MTRTPRRITSFASEARLLTDDPIPGQRKVYESAVSANFPAHQVNGIWHYYQEDLPTIMAYFGLRPKASAPNRAPRAAVEHAA